MCRAHILVHSVAFSCEAALVAVTLLKLMTEAEDPRFATGDADAVRQYRISVGVTAVSFAFTAVAFAGTVADVGALLAQFRRAARRISHAATGNPRGHTPASAAPPLGDAPDAPADLLATFPDPAASAAAGAGQPEEEAAYAEKAHPDHKQAEVAVVPLDLDGAWDPPGVSTAAHSRLPVLC